MSTKKLLVIISLVIILFIGSVLVYYDKFKTINTTSSENFPTVSSMDSANSKNTVVKNDNVVNSKSSNYNDTTTKSSKNDSSSISSEQSDISYVSYTVKENDTVWSISKANMPNYSPIDKGDKIGVITYIANENKLKKFNDSNYIIYTGQQITIPKEVSISNAEKSQKK